MKRWRGCGSLVIAWRACRPCTAFAGFRQTRLASTSNAQDKYSSFYQQYDVFQKTSIPQSNRVEDWIALLEGALPPHLRDQNVSPPMLTLASTDLAEVLLAAQRSEIGLDLLYHLGFEQGRWSAVVWLIKKIIDRFPFPRTPDSNITDSLSIWKQTEPFIAPFSTDKGDDATFDRYTQGAGQRPIYLELPADTALSHSTRIGTKSLEVLTSAPIDDALYGHNLAHEALGQIWRTLGAMTQACAGRSIRQEVLEIIAYLHHREIMPMSIYQYQPRMEKSAVQQPPLIPLLSSRIFTSLSDAAWRAREKLMIEEAKARQGGRVSDPSAVIAAPYRARVDSILPEVWLELILWSCLHGGWIEQGSCILDSVTQNNRWKPLSWREYEKALPQHDQADKGDWEAWDYLFKTRTAKSMDPPKDPIPEVRRTVSAEVVNAYIDAIPNVRADKYATRGKFLPHKKLYHLKSFLERQNLGLTIGSWDALAIRMIESQEQVPNENFDRMVKRIVKLSPGIGHGLTSKNTQDLPAYVLDGGLAMQGILDRVLHRALVAGNLEHALRAFRTIQIRADRDKLRSLASFMEGPKPLLRAALDRSDMFTSNVPGIDYPAFNLQIPSTTLAMFLDLVTDSKAYDFGHWLVYSKDADGPVIRRDMYDDPYLTPALVRFADATEDSELLWILRKLPNFSINHVLNIQINAMRWGPATAIVEFHGENKSISNDGSWYMENLANLARVMLSQIRGAEAGNLSNRDNLQKAMRLFTNMVQQVQKRKEFKQKKGGHVYWDENDLTVRIQTFLDVLAAVHAEWAEFCFNLQLFKGHHDFSMQSTVFNNLLEGVVTAYGSITGRRLLHLFWNQSGALPDTAYQPFGAERTQRIVVPYPGMAHKHRAVLYGTLRPNIRTIDIILRRALEELRDQPRERQPAPHTAVRINNDHTDGKDEFELSPRGVVVWAASRMAGLPERTGHPDVISNIDGILRELGMEELRKEVPNIVWRSGPDLLIESVDDADADADTDADDDA